MEIKRQSIGKRDEQQDSYITLKKEGVCIYLVCDGLGGITGGRIASQIAVKITKQKFKSENINKNNAKEFLENLLNEIHCEIQEIAKKTDKTPMTTITALLLFEEIAFWTHIGDSRVFYFNNKKLNRRTKDHSLVQILVDRGKLDESKMGTHPDQGKIYQSLGGRSDLDIEIDSAILKKGDWFLLCTDGFWEHLSIDELSKLSTASNNIADQLLNLALKRGGENCDNITFISLYTEFSFFRKVLTYIKSF